MRISSHVCFFAFGEMLREGALSKAHLGVTIARSSDIAKLLPADRYFWVSDLLGKKRPTDALSRSPFHLPASPPESQTCVSSEVALLKPRRKNEQD